MPFAPSGYRGARAGAGPLGQCGRTHGGREFNQICFGDIVFIQYRVEGRLFQRLAVDCEFGPIQCFPDGTFEAPERLHLNFPDLERVQYAHVNGVGSLVGEVSAYADSKLLMSLSYVNRLKAIVEEQINPALTVTDLSTVFAFDVENAAYSTPPCGGAVGSGPLSRLVADATSRTRGCAAKSLTCALPRWSDTALG